MSKIKKIILNSIDFIKKIFFLKNLSKNELQGFTSPLIRLRFLPYSEVVVPYSLGRTVRGVSFDKHLILDPLGRLCLDISNGVDNQTLSNNLSIVLDKEKDLNAADIVNLSNNINLKNYPAWAIVMPWEKLSIEDFFKAYPENLYMNRHSKGLIFKNRSRETIINTVYSSKYIDNRINQMGELYKSIKRYGIIEDGNLPKINILVKDNEWRWFMGDAGNHRSYVMSSLGYEFFNARISSIINKKDVNKWHNVKNGTYSVNDAEDVFDSHFNGSRVHRGMV
tara:strand:+ start:8272 stop:9111 length:840 start_codon:yes stop_codon:yes gene_type:complete